MLVAFGFCACETEDYYPSHKVASLTSYYLSVSGTKLEFDSKASSKKLSVETETTPWSFSGMPDWVTLSPATGNKSEEITVSVAENPSTENRRECIIELKSDVPDYPFSRRFAVVQCSAVPVSSVSLNKTSLTLDIGDTETLSAFVAPEDATNRSVIWTSSNTSVATVDGSGKVTAVSYGTVTITATSVSNASKKATCTVKVTRVTKTFTVGGVTFRMRLVEAGTFSMGTSPDGNNVTPVHNVTLTNDYYIGETEVTQALWKAVTEYYPTSGGNAWTSTYGLGNEYPAYYISYADVQSFINRLNSLTGQTFRMPTEAEWEFAAKGGNKSKGYTYSGNDAIDNVAWYTVNSYNKGTSSPDFGIHVVKAKSANELGVYDMSGNVCEWCSDRYGSYSSSAQTNPTGATSGSDRVIRGGSWCSNATYCRTTHRDYSTPYYRDYYLGVRLALSSLLFQTTKSRERTGSGFLTTKH